MIKEVFVKEKVYTKKDTKIMNTAKNQIILDKAMEEEFLKTIEIFDVFVDCVKKYNPDHIKFQYEAQNLLDAMLYDDLGTKTAGNGGEGFDKNFTNFM